MSFYYVDDLSHLRPSAFNIREPISSAPEYKSSNADICIVPALAYDIEGYRMGYGGGFYDRFLSEYSGVPVGICYEEFCGSLPVGEFDISVETVITEKGFFCGKEDFCGR